MAGDWQEAQLARRGSLPAAVARAVLATAIFAMAAVARAVFAMAVVALIAVGLLAAARPAGAADLPPLPTPTTTLPPVPVPTVPTVTLPKVTLPPVAVTVAPPKVNLQAPAVPRDPSPAAPVPAAGGTVPGTIHSPPLPAPISSFTPAVVEGGATERSSVGRAGRRADPAARPLAFRLRRAAVDTLQQLTFPLALALAMVGFLVFQHRVDKNDPRVAAPVESGDNDLLRFS